jgi:UDP-glucose:(heptosyl)LPS alpha-1,3-glucosyltransferase
MNNAVPVRKKIVIVVPKYGLVGGGERFVSEVAARMAQDPGLELHVLANQWTANSDRIRFHKIPILRFPRFLRPLSFAWFVQHVLRREKFDLVHSHHWIFHADIFSAHGVPHAHWVRNTRKKRPSLYDRALSFVERQALSNGSATIFLPVSSIAMQAFRDEYATLPGRWETMHPGVDVERFAKPDRDACRAEIRGSAPTICFCSLSA